MQPRLGIKFFNISIHSFHFFGTLGFFLGLIAGAGIAYVTNLAIWPVVLCSVIGASVLFGLTYLYKITTGREDLVYYQHEIAILICCLLLLYILNRPVLRYIDITLMGIGIFLVFGRMGCFSVGCCHGRIGKVGVKYTEAHVAEGFHRHFAGIPVFPIQLIESACVLVTVVIGSVAILKNQVPGTALLVYIVAYGVVRFTLEYFRGDTERPYWWGFSEAQWTTFGIYVVSVVLSLSGLLPHYWWHLWSLPALVLAMAATVVVRSSRQIPTHKILRPKHILELAEGIEALENNVSVNGQVLILGTSLGLNISRGLLAHKDGFAVHYTFSAEGKNTGNKKKKSLQLNEGFAKILGTLVQTLKHPSAPFEIEEGQPGIFHIIFSFHTNEIPPQEGKSNALKLRRNLRYTYN